MDTSAPPRSTEMPDAAAAAAAPLAAGGWRSRWSSWCSVAVAVGGGEPVRSGPRRARGDRRRRRSGARASLRDRARQPRVRGRHAVARAGRPPGDGARPATGRGGRASWSCRDACWRGYDEPHAMAALAGGARGRSRRRSWSDAGGHRTAATMADAAALGVRSALVVTQGYHLPRALYLARHAGIDAIGVPAPVDAAPGWCGIRCERSCGRRGARGDRARGRPARRALSPRARRERPGARCK